MKSFLFTAIGILLFGAGAALVAVDYIDSSWPRVPGEIVAIKSVNDVRTHVVTYTANGTKFQVNSSKQPLFGSFEPGKEISVAYNPNSSGEAKISQTGVLAIMPWVLAALGVLLVIVGVIIRRRQYEYYDTDEDAEPVGEIEPVETVEPQKHQV